MKKKLLIPVAILATIAIVYLMGPKPPKPTFNLTLPSGNVNTQNIDSVIRQHEAQYQLKPDNQARILWANDSLKSQTEYVLLYLHGFSASWYEGYPTNTEFVKYFGCNAFFARLADHGTLSEMALIDMAPDSLWLSAKEALAIANLLGEKVIVMCTSTGGTLALKLAAEYPDMVDGLILYSPNIRINDPAAFLLDKPWGLQLSRLAMGSTHRFSSEIPDSKGCNYWDCAYRLESVVYLQQLVNATMQPKTFERVKAPVFLAYYYKDAEHQDKTVKVEAMLWMFDHLGTPANLKQKQAFANAGDHVIGCELYSGAYSEVLQSTIAFAENTLGMKKKP